MNPNMGYLVSINQLTRESILSLYEQVKKNKLAGFSKVKPVLQNETVALIFTEPSTRTRVSFEIAAGKLGAQPILIQKDGSSLQKGETILDTFETIHAMGCRYFIYRSAGSEIHEIVHHFKDRAVIINAGDGTNEHPTQGLLDGFTIWEHVGHLNNLKIAIVGDIGRSRVAGSAIKVFNLFGIKPYVAGPKTLVKNLSKGDVQVTDVDEAISKADVVMMLRVQHERKDVAYEHSEKDYLQNYGLTPERLKLAKPGALVMHPGPFNRGVEIDDSIAYGSQSAILRQVHNGLWIRMALLENFQKVLS